MLTEEVKAKIAEQIQHYDHARAGSVEALKIVQQHHGWVSDQDLRDVALLLNMTPDELDGVATFYSMIFRRSVGQHVILICDSVSCWIMGYEDLLAHLVDRLGIGLGETTADGKFTLLPVSCLGTCDHAPALLIDDELYRDLTRERIDQVLKRFD
ncbi:MAG: NADH-quinone oxidoreductase subunit NuoE [Anaerolineae bacterium]